jgi:CMP-N-acetylneuraminic acid synthetase
MSNLYKDKGYVAIVPVRAGSKGLKGKNMRPLDGLPLYLHAVHQGLRTAGHVFISTDITEINQSNLPAGCTLCQRPDELASDDVPMASVITHLIKTHSLQGHTLVLLQATTPLRQDADIESAMALHVDGGYDLVMSIVARDQGVLKYGTLNGNHFVAMRDPTYCFQNRQSLPKVYGPNGAVYVFSAESFMQTEDFPTVRIGVVEMPAMRSIDIDTAEDFRYVEEQMVANKTNKTH